MFCEQVQLGSSHNDATPRLPQIGNIRDPSTRTGSRVLPLLF